MHSHAWGCVGCLTVLGEAERSWGQGKRVDLKIMLDIWLKNI